MAKGRKALAGTHEARLKIDVICNAISACELSEDACNRVIKAVKFGLGIKEEEKEIDTLALSSENAIIEQEDKGVVIPIKEKKALKIERPDNSEGDVYFNPEDCYEANK